MVYIGPLSLLFSILLIIDMYCEMTLNYSLMWIVKPLLMPVLLILFLLNAHHNLSIERICLIISLSFSCLGDIILMPHENNSFFFGLISFLIAHISYIISFIVRLQHENNKMKQRLTISAMIIASIPFLTYIALMVYILYPKLNTDDEEAKGLFLPVVSYTFIIVGMAYISYLRNRKSPGFWLVFIGAIFFVLSDSILAFNKFVASLPAAGLFIMSTYGIGQYLITIGTLQVTSKDSKTL